MPIVSEDDATSIASFDADIPADENDWRKGAAEIRKVKSLVKADFPNIDGPMTCTHSELNEIKDSGISNEELTAIAGSGIQSDDMARVAALTQPADAINRNSLTNGGTKTGNWSAQLQTEYGWDASSVTCVCYLPPGVVGKRVGLADESGGEWARTRPLQVIMSGSDKFHGVSENFHIDVPKSVFYLQFVGGSIGWRFA